MYDRRAERFNAVSSLIILYCLMLFTEQFMENKYQMNAIGDLLIGNTVSNLVINVVPLTIPIFVAIYQKLILKLYLKCKREKAERIRKKHLEKMLKITTKDEQQYGRKIELRANIAINS